MMKKTLVLVTFVSFFLSGCASSGSKIIEPIKLTCPTNYPTPLSLTPLKQGVHFTIYKENVEVTHAGWAILISWMHEAERFSKDATTLQKFMEDCIDRYNSSTQSVPEKDATKTWWRFW
jgi:hypothetical protein